MKIIKKWILFSVLNITLLTVNAAGAASAKIGGLVFDGFLTSDVTVPIEVFGAATKKAWF